MKYLDVVIRPDGSSNLMAYDSDSAGRLEVRDAKDPRVAVNSALDFLQVPKHDPNEQRRDTFLILGFIALVLAIVALCGCAGTQCAEYACR